MSTAVYIRVSSPKGQKTDSQRAELEACPGCSLKASATVATQIHKQLDLALRHNLLQQALYDRLVLKYGDKNVGTENVSGVGTRVDVVVKRKEEYWFYEIKTAHSPRACLREAVGQLLEYAFWPGGQLATRLIVIGETPIDREGLDTSAA
jgi:hypothetical protein